MRHATEIAGRSPSAPAASATISGDGVSPAASAAARGSPPEMAAATDRADFGRLAGSGSRQLRIARFTVGSRPSIWLDGRAAEVTVRERGRSSGVSARFGRFPVTSS